MSIKRWSYSIVPATLLLAATASADPAAAPAKSPGPAAAAAPQADNPQARPALVARAAAEGKQGRRADSPTPAAEVRADAVPGHSEHGHQVAAAAPDHAGHENHEPVRVQTSEGTAAGQADARRAHHNQVRRERAKELRGRLKSRGVPNQLRVELRTHAKRIAQIERIRTLAAADAKLVTRIDAVLLQENERHTRRMTRLVDEANQAPTEGTAPAEAAPVAAPTDADKAAAPPTEAQKPTQQGVTP